MSKDTAKHDYLRASGGRDLFTADPQETEETISMAAWLVMALSLAMMIAGIAGFLGG